MKRIRVAARIAAQLSWIAAAAGCASAYPHQTAESVPSAASARTTEPLLLDCRDFTSPDPDLAAEFAVVTVPVLVSADGAVESVGTPRASRAPRDQTMLDRAIALARSCVFEPASRDGSPISSRTEVHFRLGRSGRP